MEWVLKFIQSSDFYAWVILPMIIFFARICDVTLGTIRIILVSRGKRKIAPLLGFFEVLIWIVVIGQLVQNLQSATSFIGYAAGFAAGNFVGMYIEDKLAMGTVIVRAILPNNWQPLVERLYKAGFGLTCVDGQGVNGPVKLVYTVVKRKHLSTVIRIIHEITPGTFFSVEDVRNTEMGVFPSKSHTFEPHLFWHKGK